MELLIPLIPVTAGYSVTIDGIVYHAARGNDSGELVVAISDTFTPTTCGSGAIAAPVSPNQAVLGVGQCRAVSVEAFSTNAGIIYIGDAAVTTVNGRQLNPGASIDFAIDSLAKVYVTGTVLNDAVSYFWVL